jgi:hypothetical protein
MKSAAIACALAGSLALAPVTALAQAPTALPSHYTSICSIAKRASRSYGKYFRIKATYFENMEYHIVFDDRCPNVTIAMELSEDSDPSVSAFFKTTEDFTTSPEHVDLGAYADVDAYVRYTRKSKFESNNKTFQVLKLISYKDLRYRTR